MAVAVAGPPTLTMQSIVSLWQLPWQRSSCRLPSSMIGCCPPVLAASLPAAAATMSNCCSRPLLLPITTLAASGAMACSTTATGGQAGGMQPEAGASEAGTKHWQNVN